MNGPTPNSGLNEAAAEQLLKEFHANYERVSAMMDDLAVVVGETIGTEDQVAVAMDPGWGPPPPVQFRIATVRITVTVPVSAVSMDLLKARGDIVTHMHLRPTDAGEVVDIGVFVIPSQSLEDVKVRLQRDLWNCLIPTVEQDLRAMRAETEFPGSGPGSAVLNALAGIQSSKGGAV